jgi:hypothetical protein
VATFAWRRFICWPDGELPLVDDLSNIERAYQTSMFLISANCAIAARYSRVAVTTTERRIALVKPRSRPATAPAGAGRSIPIDISLEQWVGTRRA